MSTEQQQGSDTGSEGRPARASKKKINYGLFHEVGRTEVDSDSGGEIDFDKNTSFVPIGGAPLVEETPLNTPINVQIIDETGVIVVPESQIDPRELGDNQNLDLDPRKSNMEGSSLHDELTEAQLKEKREQLDKEHEEMERRAKIITEQTKLEAKERQVQLMKKKIDELLELRKKAKESDPVLNQEVQLDDPVSKDVKELLDMLKKDQEVKEKREQELKEENERKEKEEEERKRLEDEEKRKQEEEKRKEEERQSESKGDPNMDKVLAWIHKQEEQAKKDEEMNTKLKNLQTQIENMTREGNRKQCHATGVNLFANLEAIQGEGAMGVNLAAKAQTAMLASSAAKRKLDEDSVESEGESAHSQVSQSGVKKKLKSGLTASSSQKVIFDIEWAHHWLGKEFDANPMDYKFISMGHYMMGEAEILLQCTKPEEFRARLKLMRKLAYWQLKYDWPVSRDIYAAIMRGLETGRETWGFNTRDYEDMLIAPSTSTMVNNPPRQPYNKPPRRPRDVFFCAAFQRG